MKNPRVTAALSALAIVLVGCSMLFSAEAPSTAVTVLEWLFLAGGAIGLIGALVQIANGR